MFIAKSISFSSAKPVESITGFLVLATFINRGKWLISGDAILYAEQFNFSKKSTALSSNGVENIISEGQVIFIERNKIHKITASGKDAAIRLAVIRYDVAHVYTENDY